MDNKDLQVSDFFHLDVEKYLNKQVTKALFGGYSKKHVEQYFCELNKDMIAMKDNLERQITDLTLENNCLVQEIEVLREQLKEAEFKNMTLSQALEAGDEGEASLQLVHEIAQLRGELDCRDKALIQKDSMLGEAEERLKQEKEKVEKMRDEMKLIQDSQEVIRKEEETTVKKDAGFLELLTQQWNEYKEEKKELAKNIKLVEASKVQIRLWCGFISDINSDSDDKWDTAFAECHAESEKQSREMRGDFENIINDEVTIEQILSNMTFMEEMNRKVLSNLKDSIAVMGELSKRVEEILDEEEVRLTVLQEKEPGLYTGDLDMFKKEAENRQEELKVFMKEKMDSQDRINRYEGIYDEIEKEMRRLEEIGKVLAEE